MATRITMPAGAARSTPGRNDPSSCGSGRKYKHCCGVAPAKAANVSAPSAARHATPDARLADIAGSGRATASGWKLAGSPRANVAGLAHAARQCGDPARSWTHLPAVRSCPGSGCGPTCGSGVKARLRPRLVAAWRRTRTAGGSGSSVDAYRQAVALLPSLADAQFRLACLLEGHGHRTDAVRHFRLAAAAEAKSSLGRVAEARALLAEERDSEAEKVLRQCLALDRKNALAQDMLGTCTCRCRPLRRGGRLL